MFALCSAFLPERWVYARLSSSEFTSTILAPVSGTEWAMSSATKIDSGDFEADARAARRGIRGFSCLWGLREVVSEGAQATRLASRQAADAPAVRDLY